MRLFRLDPSQCHRRGHIAGVGGCAILDTDGKIGRFALHLTAKRRIPPGGTGLMYPPKDPTAGLASLASHLLSPVGSSRWVGGEKLK